MKIPKPEVKESDAAGEEMEEEMEEEVPEETVEEEDPSPAAKKKPAANLPIAPSDKRDTSTKESGDGGKRGKIVSGELKKMDGSWFRSRLLRSGGTGSGSDLMESIGFPM